MSTPEETIAAQAKQIQDLQAIAAKIPELSKSVEALTEQNKSLLTNLQSKDQEVKATAETVALKTAFPNVPHELLVGATFEEKKAHAEKLSAWAKGQSKGGANGAGSESGQGGWQNASGTGASTDVEEQARVQEAAKKEAEAVKSGNVMDTVRLTVARQMKVASRWIGPARQPVA